MSSRSEIATMIAALNAEDQWALALETLKSLGPSKTKARKNADAPPRPVAEDSFMHFLHRIIAPTLKELSESATGDDKALYRQVPTKTQIAAMLWAPIAVLKGDERMRAIEAVNLAAVSAAFKAWKLNPPEKAYKSKKDSDSVTSSGSSASKPKSSKPKKMDSMTEDEKKAHFQARAAKAAASRAANKAKQVAEAAQAVTEASLDDEFEDLAVALETTSESKPTEVEEESESAPEEVDPYPWEHNFGKGMKTYERADVDGMAYIYDADTKEYLGAWIESTNKLNKKIPDPFDE